MTSLDYRPPERSLLAAAVDLAQRLVRVVVAPSSFDADEGNADLFR